MQPCWWTITARSGVSESGIQQENSALTGMIALSLVYLASVTLLSVSLWLDPLGPVVKVLPSILLTVVALAILDER